MPGVFQEGRKKVCLLCLHSEEDGCHGNVYAGAREIDLPVHREQMGEDIEEWLVEKTEVAADIPGESGAAVVRVVSCEDRLLSSLTVNSPCCRRRVEVVGWVEGRRVEVVVCCLLCLLVEVHSHCSHLEAGKGHMIQAENVDDYPVEGGIEDIHRPVEVGKPIGSKGFGFGVEEIQQGKVVGMTEEAVRMERHYLEVGRLFLKLSDQIRW